MKIRLDFVSNSSSSSFMIVGTAFSYDKLENAWNKLHPDQEFEDPEDLAYELGLDCVRGIYDYYEEYVIGLPYCKMSNDETKAEFEERILQELKTAFPNLTIKDIGACIDGGYDG